MNAVLRRFMWQLTALVKGSEKHRVKDLCFVEYIFLTWSLWISHKQGKLLASLGSFKNNQAKHFSTLRGWHMAACYKILSHK